MRSSSSTEGGDDAPQINLPPPCRAVIHDGWRFRRHRHRRRLALEVIIMGKPVKFASGDVIFKKVLNSAAINVGELAKVIADDAGAMVPVSPLNKVAGEFKSSGSTKGVLHLGVLAGNLLVNVQGTEGFATSEVVVKNYTKLKEDRAKAVVINAQKGDSTIDSSSKKMAKVKGTTEVTPEDAELKEVKGNIIILAHGAATGNIPGQVYAKEFGNKKAADIINFLVNQKKLPTSYSGILYLDGCYTAAGPKQGKSPQELTNFCKQVYDGLKRAGYEHLQVKGNLGLAATQDDGTESVSDAQMEKEIENATKKLREKIQKLEKTSDKLAGQLRPLLNEKRTIDITRAKLEKGEGDYDPDKRQKMLSELDKKLAGVQSKLQPVIKAKKKFDEEADKLRIERQKVVEGLKKKGISDEKIKDLVGTFGPEKAPVS
jgi:hypothetical protein